MNANKCSKCNKSTNQILEGLCENCWFITKGRCKICGVPLPPEAKIAAMLGERYDKLCINCCAHGRELLKKLR